MGHPAPHRDLDAHGALLLHADPVLFGFADHGRVHPFGVPAPDKSLDPGHHALFVYGMTEDQTPGKRHAGVFDSPRRHDRRRQVPLRIAGPAAVDASPGPLRRERRVLPVLRRPLRHHVRVRLKEKGPARTIALPHGPDVRPSRRDLLGLHLEAGLLQILRHEPGGTLLVAGGIFRTVDAREADQLLRQTDELLAVDKVPDLLQQVVGLVQRARRRSGSTRQPPRSTSYHATFACPALREKGRHAA